MKFPRLLLIYGYYIEHKVDLLSNSTYETSTSMPRYSRGKKTVGSCSWQSKKTTTVCYCAPAQLSPFLYNIISLLLILNVHVRYYISFLDDSVFAFQEVKILTYGVINYKAFGITLNNPSTRTYCTPQICDDTIFS